MLNSRNFRTGIRLVGNTTLTGSVLGDLQAYTVDGKLYYFDGSVNSPVVTEASSGTISNKTINISTTTFADGSDPTKHIVFNDSGATTGTTLTISGVQTVNRNLTLPDATDTLVGRATIDTLTNKSISGSANTITNISLTTSVTGVLPIVNGGTSASTKTAAFDALSPMTTGGDIIYGGASGTGLRLANGSAGQVLTSAGTTLAPTWTTPSPGFVNPMTSVGDLIVGGTAGAATRLAVGSTGQVLTVSGGTAVWAPVGGGTVTAVTGSGNIASSGGTTPNITFTGILPVANGGTGSGTQNFVDLTTAQSISGAKTFNNALTFTQISTPATPSATHNDLYFKSDGFLYMLDSNGVESLVSPGISGTDWKNDLTFTASAGFGTITNSNFWYRRVGDTMEVRGSFTTGTTGASTAFIQLPTSYTIDTTKFSSTASVQRVGIAANLLSAQTNLFDNNQVSSVLFYDGSTNNEIFVAVQVLSGTYNKINGSGIIVNNSPYSFEFSVPIAGWTVNNGAQPGQHGATFFASSRVTTESGSISSTSFTNFDNSPAFTFTPTITGTYKVYCTFPLQSDTATDQPSVRIFNTSGSATLLYESQDTNFYNSGSVLITSVSPRSIYTLTAGISYVFNIQGKVSNGSHTLENRGDTSPFYMFAELSTNGAGIGGGGLTNPMTTGGDTIYGGASGVPTRLANGTNGQVLTSSGGTAAPTWTTPSAGSSGLDFFASSHVTTDSSSVTATTFTTFSNSPGFAFTPNFTGKYKVYCFAPLKGTTGSSAQYCRITNTVGSATLLNEQAGVSFDNAGANFLTTVPTQSIYTLTASTSYTFEIQGKVDSSGSCTLAGAGSNTANNFYLFAERIG